MLQIRNIMHRWTIYHFSYRGYLLKMKLKKECKPSVSMPPEIRIGTSAFTAAGWAGTFYPEGLPEREYLSYYATRFDTVEVDSTFYRTPSQSTVQGWNAKTP